MSSNKKWPEDYPKHIKVPPLNAQYGELNLYRFLIKKDVFTATDFLASYKDPLQKQSLVKNKNNPHFYATSFFISKEKAIEKKKQLPEKFKNHSIAEGFVCENDGCFSKNDNGHVSVWFYDGAYPKGFKII